MMRFVVDLMGLKKSVCAGALVLAATLLSGGQAHAQAARDYPTLRGNNQNQGHNGDPNNSGSGYDYLRWFYPNGVNTLGIVLDDTDFADTTVAPFVGGPYTPQPLGNVVTSSPVLTGVSNPTTGWGFPRIDQEAYSPYVPPRRSVPIGTSQPDFNPRNPAYLFSRCTPSAFGSDPTIAKTPADLRYIQWQITPPGAGSRFMQLYAWLPTGPTNLAVPPAVNQIFPQRYFVYEIKWGPLPTQRYVDVVDRNLAGYGFVRLGGGGGLTNNVFPYDGVNPTTIKLFNTVPRDIDGVLTQPWTNNENEVSNYCVYADAVRSQPTVGSYAAAPTVMGGGSVDIRTVAALNSVSVGTRDSAAATIIRGVATSYQYNNGTPLWTYSPAVTSDIANNVDNLAATQNGVDFGTSTASSRFQGTNYLAGLIPGAVASSSVTYAPDIDDGTYEIYAFISGDNNGERFGHGVIYQIYEGALLADQIAVDQSGSNGITGWVKIGFRRYSQNRLATPTGQPLRVVVTNASGILSDIGKKSYADAVRFVGASNFAINSTPVNVNALIKKNDGTTVDTRVTIIADERGYIHCLDQIGNLDGTTTEYWSYPSFADPNVTPTTDPNQVAGLDGVGPIAKMPTSFDLSTAVVQRIGGIDYLYIAAQNGRVYCIDMAGRGDYDTNKLSPGTTTRRWTYPNDYPSTIKTTTLGAIRGTLTFAVLASGPTIFVPAREGRIYALDALGNGITKTTTERWTYPLKTAATLGPIVMTPSFEFGHLYFGTQRKDENPGVFYALNPDGTVLWSRNADVDNLNTDGTPVLFDDWDCSPATVSAATLQAVSPDPGGDVDYVYALNQNRYLYAFNAATGATQWSDNELSIGSIQSLTYTTITYNKLGIGPRTMPVILVPGQGATTVAMFARVNDFYDYGFGLGISRIARYFGTNGDANSIAVANNWLYITDSGGFIQARNNDFGSLTGTSPFPPDGFGPEDPRGDVYRKAKMKLLTKAGYQALRQATGTPGHLQYSNVVPGTAGVIDPRDGEAKTIYEWGETVYVLVYDLPYSTIGSDGTTQVPPPQVNVQFSVQGQVVRSVAADTRQFSNPNSARTFNQVDPLLWQLAAPEGDTRMDGYVVVPFTFQGAGPNKISPGDGDISFTVASYALGTNQIATQIAMPQKYTHRPFYMANPLALIATTDLAGTQVIASLGTQTDPTDPNYIIENGVNGTPIGNPIATSAGFGTHGGTTSGFMQVIDRSLMTLISPDGLGLPGIKVLRKDLAWQGGSAKVINPIDITLYPGFEEFPINFPNISLDYPDIAAQQVRATKDPLGNSENPILHTATLLAPLPPVGSTTIDDSNKFNRRLRNTPFEFDTDIPRYQPPNDSTLAIGAFSLPVGYAGRFTVYVDSGNGTFDSLSNREAYRSFSFGTGVNPDSKLVVTTPTVDLGSQAAGSGYNPGQPGTKALGSLNPGDFHPWETSTGGGYAASAYGSMFQSFTVLSESNVNLRHIRLALATTTPATTPPVLPWAFFAGANDANGYLDGSLSMWSDIDTPFAPTGQVLLQKPRVGDPTGTALSANPVRRENANLGVLGGQLVPDGALRFTPQSPRIAVTIPLGFPVGKYTQTVRIIDEDEVKAANWNEYWDAYGDGHVETYSDPTLELFFTVRESRATGTYTRLTAPMIDNLIPPGTTPNLTYTSLQPTGVRDAFGSLVMAWASNRVNEGTGDPSDTPNPTVPTVPITNDKWRIYLAAVDNGATFASTGITGAPRTPNTPGYAESPIRDLGAFSTTGAGWFRKSADSTQGYPKPGTDFNALFGINTAGGESLDGNTLKFGSPSFPQRSDRDPFYIGNPEDNAAKFTGIFMGFVGEAQVTAGGARTTASHEFLTRVTTDAGGNATLSNPMMVPGDSTTSKGKPSVLQTSTGALLFYGATGTGTSSIVYSRLLQSGTAFGPAVPLSFGSGFSSVFDPSVSGRVYRGVASGQRPLAELTFAGRLRGRPSAEVFLGRMNVGIAPGDSALQLIDNAGKSIEGPDANTPFVYLPQQSNERLLATGESGVFRARGVSWNRTAPIQLLQSLKNQAPTDLLVAGSGSYDANSNLISFSTTLGGKVYLDPNLGTIRFSSGIPSNQAELRLTYTARFLRISAGGPAAYSNTSGLFDWRFASDGFYWRRQNGNAVTPSDDIRNDRYVFTYGRSAGSGQAARPAIETMRLGIRLPYRIATGRNGVPVSISVTGNVGPYQLDPANGRVYFTGLDEDSQVSVVFTGVDDNGSAVAGAQATANVSFVLERAEEQILIEQAVNESNVTSFLDPFSFLTNDNVHGFEMRRPPLMWMFWTSTRAGSPDVYFQSINPRLSPIVVTGQ